MKIADPDRGWRKFHDDIKKKRNLTRPNETPQSQPQQVQYQQPTPIQQQPVQQPILQQQQPIAQPPNVTYNMNPPQQAQSNVQAKKSRLGLFIVSIALIVFVAFLLQPEQTIGVFHMIGERISNLWQTAQGAMQ